MNRGFLRLLLVSIAVVGIPSGVCQSEYEKCESTFECGSLRNISYPFYGGSRPISCGYRGFELTCQGEGAPLINISSIIFRLLAVDNQRQVMRVARNDLWSSLCSPLLRNTSFDRTLYSFDPAAGDEEIALLHDCTGQLEMPNPNLLFYCNSSWNIFVTRGAATTTLRCSSAISIRVDQTAAGEIRNPNTTLAQLQTSLRSGFSIRWLTDDRRCERCVQSAGSCGYDEYPSSFTCLCNGGAYESTCPNIPGSRHSGSGLPDWLKYVIIGVCSCIPVLVILSIIYYKKHLRFHSLTKESNQNVENFLLAHGSLAPKRYAYKDVKKMTKSFKEKLGQGGYGIVYKGKLPAGQLVAVKLLTETHDKAEEFINEVASISRTSHVNIVNLLGFCCHRNKRALIYEFMPNKSLDKFIYKNGSTSDCLDLDKLYEVALGVARGLDYLHRGCNTRIVHFDIKPQNILLDEDFSPKISDFGLAKLVKKKQSVVSMLGTRGTIGYIAPEVFSRNFGVVSHKSDVYSYGMLLIEIAGARKIDEAEPNQSSENYFPEKIYEYILVRNTELGDITAEEKEETVRKMLMVGLWCIQTAPSDRPSMSKVIEMLEASLESIQIPPKPVFSSQMLLESDEFSSSMNMDTENPTHSGN